MPVSIIHLRAVCKDLRAAGIPVTVSNRDGAALLQFPTLGGEDVAALRMLHPILQNVRIRTTLAPKLTTRPYVRKN